MDDGQVIYYGVQLLVAHVRDKLGPDRLFCTRAACIPVDDWTGAIWKESARIVGIHQEWLAESATGDPPKVEIVGSLLDTLPIEEVHIDARTLTPRPADDQLVEIAELAEKLRSRHSASTPKFDIHLTKDLGFAVIANRRIPENVLHELPGYNEHTRQCWLSPELRDFIINEGLSCAPNVLTAIADDIARIQQQAPWGLFLEKASACVDPAKFPLTLSRSSRKWNWMVLLGSQLRSTTSRRRRG